MTATDFVTLGHIVAARVADGFEALISVPENMKRRPAP
jgi:hypothetical protein